MVDRNSFLQAPLHHVWVMGSSLTCENNSHITLSPLPRFLLVLPVELVQKHRSWTRMEKSEAPFSRRVLWQLYQAREVSDGEGPDSASPTASVIPALQLRARCSWTQQHMVLQGWGGAETTPVLWPLSKPPPTFAGKEIFPGIQRVKQPNKQAADRESCGNK